MKILTEEECNKWLSRINARDHRVPMKLSRPELRSIGPSQWFTVPLSARYYLIVAHRLIKWFDFSECLLLITDWPSFSDEEMKIFMEMRRLYGCDKSLIDAPGHCFEIQDVQKLACFIHYVLILNWEGVLINREGNSIVLLADEVIELITESFAKAQEARNTFEDLGISSSSIRS